MRIVFVNQYYAPADAPTALLLADVAESLVRVGHEVRVVCSRRPYPESSGSSYARREKRNGVEVLRVASTGYGRGSRVGRLADYATFVLGAGLRLLREEEADVIVSLTTPPMIGWLTTQAGRWRRWATVHWVMDVYPDLAFELGVVRPGSIVGRTLRRLASSSLRRATRTVALGESMAERLRASGAAQVSVIHNWADGDRIAPLARGEHPLREEWSWGDRFVVLYSGNLGLAHEFETVVDAAERLRDRERILFAFVGSGPRRDELEREVRRRGLPNVEFRPYIDRERLPLSLTSADLHLVSLREGLQGLLVPSKIYGILAAGLPTVYVGPRGSEIAAILDDADCGTRVDPGDGVALAETIAGYADLPARGEEEGRRARAAFEERYAKPVALDAWRRLLEGLA